MISIPLIKNSGLRLLVLLVISSFLLVMGIPYKSQNQINRLTAGAAPEPMQFHLINRASSRAETKRNPSEHKTKSLPKKQKKLNNKPSKKVHKTKNVEKMTHSESLRKTKTLGKQPKELLAQQASAPKVASAGVSEMPLLKNPTFRGPPAKPIYPRRARASNQQGRVKVEAKLDKKGDVVKAIVLDSSGFRLLDQAALNAVRKWQFQPLQKNGVSLPSKVIVPVLFQLN